MGVDFGPAREPIEAGAKHVAVQVGVNETGAPIFAEIPIDTTNDYLLSAGQNLPNHTMTRAGLGRYVTQSLREVPLFRTKQEAFRYAAWLSVMADAYLPDDPDAPAFTFEQVRDAVRST